MIRRVAQTSQQGFTLIEVLLVMAIFAIIGIAGFQVVDTMVDTEQHSGERQRELERLQYAMLIMERDFRYLVARPVRGEQGTDSGQYIMSDPNVSDSEADTIGFVRTGYPNPSDMLPRSTLQPVLYRVFEQQLQRLSHPYVDQVGVDPDIEILLENVEDFQIRYIANRISEDDLQSDDNRVGEWNRSGQLPLAIEVIVSTESFGDIRRLFDVNDAQVTAPSVQSEQGDSDD